MKVSALARYFFTGVVLANGVPHVIWGVTGRSHLTPFGRNSPAVVNVVWGFMNFVGGYLLLRRTDRRTGVKADAAPRLIALTAGALIFSSWGAIYESRHSDADDEGNRPS